MIIILADDSCPFNNAFLFYENAISLQQNRLHKLSSLQSLWDGHKSETIADLIIKALVFPNSFIGSFC